MRSRELVQTATTLRDLANGKLAAPGLRYFRRKHAAILFDNVSDFLSLRFCNREPLLERCDHNLVATFPRPFQRPFRPRLVGLLITVKRLIPPALLTVSFLVSVVASFRGGYIGPDYHTHLARLIEWPKIFDFGATNPPLYYLLGHGLFRIIGSSNAFPITLSILTAIPK